MEAIIVKMQKSHAEMMAAIRYVNAIRPVDMLSFIMLEDTDDFISRLNEVGEKVSEFNDLAARHDKMFAALPEDAQKYLIEKYGVKNAKAN